MSMPMHIPGFCSVCEKESDQITLGSSNQFGAPDLDLRPPEMLRSTMRWWLQECPYCGYISDNLTDLTSVDEDWLNTDAYKSVDGLTFKSDLAVKFYKYHMINVADRNTRAAFIGALRAAWVCDDENDMENAVSCRLIALKWLDEMIGACGGTDEDSECENYRVMRMDLLRRTSQFAKVIEEYSEVEFSSEIKNQICRFQVELSKKSDAGCYRISDCSAP